MDQYRAMALFAEVVGQGSMTAAARALRMTPSAVSQQLRQLEQSLGVTLLHRTTRKLTLTEAGARFHEGCAAMVAAAQSAEQALARLRDAPEGELRLAAPVGMGPRIAPALAPLLVAHPALTLRLFIDDTPIDLVEQRIDLALRVGSFADSSHVARRIGSLPRVVVASPAYLARRGWPAHPQELGQHDWLVMQPRSAGPVMIELHPEAGGEAAQALRVEGRAVSSNQLSLQYLCEAGLGLAVMVVPDIRDALREGRLVRVLPGWRLEDFPIYAVTPRRDEQPAKVRYALDALHAALGGATSAHMAGAVLG
ncbi:LysR family transcriptional regulator [Caldimonas sp. KR1-144]|uniref:LysR family transcriptional regulator n=1 Tax=Caldimonas sp. KR1-144 TaxID=3400911 RepID=UPI003C0A7A73